ncbi:hypothetical protein Bsp3421_002686 [Burkholderia sp. FERM BP-3421]|uniref:hypothetical protein n=1 Tax=Burkholderia sp. FERM BP-3421 TaxID=1494466 RepID=UPI00236081AE|nr:hypothetical protein [Burkholderia sp. FERM BP-3421]WDD92664.1 hypothetical protein Bsp3421_002686 [Burkholderia sp. FERM BP-3421]
MHRKVKSNLIRLVLNFYFIAAGAITATTLTYPIASSANPNDVITSQRDLKDGYSGYHGVTYGNVDSVLNGIKRTPTGGNDSPEWKAWYLGESQDVAAAYAGAPDSMWESDPRKADKVAGAVTQAKIPGKVREITINLDAKNPNDIKKALGLDVNKPLMDQLGDKNVLRKWGVDAAVLRVPLVDGGFEVAVPWSTAEGIRPTVIKRFDGNDMTGGRDLQKYVQSLGNKC